MFKGDVSTSYSKLAIATLTRGAPHKYAMDDRSLVRCSRSLCLITFASPLHHFCVTFVSHLRCLTHLTVVALTVVAPTVFAPTVVALTVVAASSAARSRWSTCCVTGCRTRTTR